MWQTAAGQRDLNPEPLGAPRSDAGRLHRLRRRLGRAADYGVAIESEY
jgi:hypothetical protein